MRVGAIIQARMQSTRLPGKTLLNLAGEPILSHVLRRVLAVRGLDQVVLATTERADDDPVAALGERMRVGVFRGSEEDVLDRYLQAARAFTLDIVVRVTGEDPLVDPETVEQLLALHAAAGADYSSNLMPRTFPVGLDAEVFPTGLLEDLAGRPLTPEHREHVTLFVREHPEEFKTANLWAPPWLYGPDLRFTVDTGEDFRLMEAIYARFYRAGQLLPAREAVALVRRSPELEAINRHVPHSF